MFDVYLYLFLWGNEDPDVMKGMIAGIAIVFFDRAVRYIRMFFIHMNWTSGEAGGMYGLSLLW